MSTYFIKGETLLDKRIVYLPGKYTVKVSVQECTETSLTIKVKSEDCYCNRTIIMRPIDTVSITPRRGCTTIRVNRMRSLCSPLGQLDNIGIRISGDQLVQLSEDEMAEEIDAIMAREAEDIANGAIWQPRYHTSGHGYVITITRGWADRMHDSITAIYYTEPLALEAAIQVIKDWVAANKN